MKIIVTQHDINLGQRRSADFCPVALAATRAFGEKILVTPKRLWNSGSKMSIGSRSKSVFLPKKAMDFIINFDSFKQVEPFEFEVGKLDTDPV